MPAKPSPRGRWVAIVTGALSVAIGVIYLVLITVLDSRGPMRPPPPEALAAVEVDGARSVAAVQPHALPPRPESVPALSRAD